MVSYSVKSLVLISLVCIMIWQGSLLSQLSSKTVTSKVIDDEVNSPLQSSILSVNSEKINHKIETSNVNLIDKFRLVSLDELSSPQPVQLPKSPLEGTLSHLPPLSSSEPIEISATTAELKPNIENNILTEDPNLILTSEVWKFPYTSLNPEELTASEQWKLKNRTVDCSEEVDTLLLRWLENQSNAKQKSQDAFSGKMTDVFEVLAPFSFASGCQKSPGWNKCDTNIWDGGWSLHQRRMSNYVTICDGNVSRIHCVINSNQGTVTKNDPVVRFCWVESLFAPKAVSGFHGGAQICSDDRWGGFEEEPEACRFTAYCEPSGWWADSKTVFKAKGGSHNHGIFQAWGKIRRSPFGRRLVQIQSDKSKWPIHIPRVKFRRMYLSLGDCAARHSMSSPNQGSETRKLGEEEERREGSNRINHLLKNQKKPKRGWTAAKTTTISFSDNTYDTQSKNQLATTYPISQVVSRSNKAASTVSFNPAHCHADILNAASVTKLIDDFYHRKKTDKEDWISLLLLGHHYYRDNRRDAEYADNISSVQWERNLDNDIFQHHSVQHRKGDGEGNKKKETAKNKYIRKEKIDKLAMFSDQWPVMAAWSALFKGRVFTRENFYTGNYFSTNALPFDDIQVDDGEYFAKRRDISLDEEFAFQPNEELSLVALSPSSMSSFWWPQKNCRARLRSPVFADMRSKMDQTMDEFAVHAWKVYGSRVLRKAVARHWPSSLRSTAYGDSEASKNSNNSTDQPPTLSKSAESTLQTQTFDWLRGDTILYVDRAAYRGSRRLKNSNILWKQMKITYGSRHPLLWVVTDSKMSYMAQYALWRSAKLVIGIHGGNLAGSMWLSPGQALIELGFGGCLQRHTQFGHTAVALGARYRCVEMNKGANMDDGGSVNVTKVIHRVAEVLHP